MTFFNNNIYIRVSRNKFHVRHLEKGVTREAISATGFTTMRVLVGNFSEAERILKSIVKEIGGVSFFSIKPRILIHPIEMLEGGLSQVEERVLHELAIAAGAIKARVYVGSDLTDEKIMNLLQEKVV
jgi:rod shape-determining protein MreB and related proteins